MGHESGLSLTCSDLIKEDNEEEQTCSPLPTTPSIVLLLYVRHYMSSILSTRDLRDLTSQLYPLLYAEFLGVRPKVINIFLPIISFKLLK